MAYRHESRRSLLAGDSVYQPFEGGYHDREGLAPLAAGPGSRQEKMYRPGSLWTWTFMITALVQAAVILAFES